MTDLQDALDQIKARLDRSKWEGDAFDQISNLELSQADVPRLLEAVEAVLKEAKDADNQDRLISPSILRKRLTDKLGEDDERA